MATEAMRPRLSPETIEAVEDAFGELRSTPPDEVSIEYMIKVVADSARARTAVR